MRPKHLIAFLLVVAGTLALNATRGGTLPLPAHHPVASFTPSHCLDTGVWQTRLQITADVPGGVAHLATQSTGFDLPLPVDNLFTVSGGQATYTVVVTVRWPDGFAADLGPLTATGPTGGCVTPSPSTTTCEQAIPIRDCTPTTEAPPSTTTPTTAPTAPSTSAPTVPDTSSVAPTVPGASSSPSAPTPSRPPPSTPVSLTLPPTGTDYPVQRALIGLAAAIVGSVVVITTRRRAS